MATMPTHNNKCLMVKNIPLGTDKWKKDKNLNKKQIIQALFCISMWVLGLQSLV
jgi:hypothetical protein